MNDGEVDDLSDLAAFWPDLAELPDGVDVFSQYLIAGKPTEDNDERETAFDAGDGNGELAGGAIAPGV